VPVIDAEDCINNLTVILQVHQHQAGALVTRAVKVQHLVPFVAEPSYYAPAELSTSARNSDSHSKLPYASRGSGDDLAIARNSASERSNAPLPWETRFTVIPCSRAAARTRGVQELGQAALPEWSVVEHRWA
jgi:hypothetical protein